MLALSDPQWTDFDTYSDEGGDIPDNFQAWMAAIGTPDEEGRWGWLRDQFLCQHTIKDAAIAIVPHICGLLPSTAADLRHFYAIDLGQVHMAWRSNPIKTVPPELAAAYETSIVSIRPWACECLTRELHPVHFRYLMSACASLCDHTALGRFLFSLDGLSDDFAKLAAYL